MDKNLAEFKDNSMGLGIKSRNVMGNRDMDKEFIENIQKRVVNLLLTLSDNLQIAAKDQCSEVAQLVGCWVLDEYPKYRVQICKGELSNELAHDILVVENDNVLFLIDPTIWQTFPKSESVFIGSARNMPDAIGLLKKKYSGTWKISEIVREHGKSYQQELLAAIKNNRQETVEKCYGK